LKGSCVLYSAFKPIHDNIIGDKDIPIAILDTPEASSIAHKQKKLPAAYEALGRYGFKFTTYEER
jgi:hypothetical protein